MSIPPPPPPPAGPPGPPAGLPVAPAPHVPGPHVPGPAGAAVTAGAAPAAATPLAAWQAAVAVAAGLALVGGFGWAGVSAFKAVDDATSTAAPTTPAAPTPGATPDATPGVEPTVPTPARVDLTAQPTTWRLSAADVAGTDVGGAIVLTATPPQDPAAPTPPRTVLTTSTDDSTYLAGVDLATGAVAWRAHAPQRFAGCHLVDAERVTCDAWNAAGRTDVTTLSLADGATLGTSTLAAYVLLGVAPHPDGILLAAQAECAAVLAVLPTGGGDMLRFETTQVSANETCGSDVFGGIELNDRWINVVTDLGGVVADRVTLENADVVLDYSPTLHLVGTDGWARSSEESTVVTTGALDHVELPGEIVSGALCSTVPRTVVVGTDRIPLDGGTLSQMAAAFREHDGTTVAACDWGVVVNSQTSEMTTPSRLFGADGTEIWSADLGMLWTIVADPDVLVDGDMSELRGVSTLDGSTLWSVPVPEAAEWFSALSTAPRHVESGAVIFLQGGPEIQALVFPTVP